MALMKMENYFVDVQAHILGAPLHLIIVAMPRGANDLLGAHTAESANQKRLENFFKLKIDK